MLINAEIRKMDESFLDVFKFVRVGVGGKSCEALIEHINSERVVARNEDIDAEIVFEIVDEVWVGDVFGDESIFAIFEFGVFCDHFDASSAGLVGGFEDPELVLFGVFSGDFEAVEV